ncbi:hypothetical protein SYNGFB01_02900 [Synechococcus sp. GFB01]|nr:STAS/SEC14 domain-containing protein [Synechococcus sp. GFB01]KMM17605.1 hypothetical protein SYNGFB01_02900 [Synechococcus sp. GFB01]
MRDDTLLGLRHWRGFERIALVSDVTWLGIVMWAVEVAMPCPIRLFAAHEQEEARAYEGVVGDEDREKLAARLLSRFTQAGTRCFDDTQAEQAEL